MLLMRLFNYYQLYFYKKPFLDSFLKVEIFNGGENQITLNQTHSKKFHCTYLLHYYPFDTQVN